MDRTTQPLVSVMTPVYNGEHYLAECIESVLAQTYDNWEYVIVNNCSTDRSLEIAQQYAQKDSRIRVYDNPEFLAMVPNFNHALRQVSEASKYCKIVHADDWLFPDCISEMAKLAEEHPSVVIVGSYVLEDTRVACDGLPYPSTVVPGIEICRWHLLDNGYIFGSPTSLLIRSEAIRGTRAFYDESLVQTVDQEVCFRLLQEGDLGFVHQVLSFTRVHQASQTSSFQALNRWIREKLAIAARYGPLCLDDQQYRECLQRWVAQYYEFLGDSVFRKKDEAFWAYHKAGLEAVGLPLNRIKLSQAAMRQLYLKLLHFLEDPVTISRNVASAARRKRA